MIDPIELMKTGRFLEAAPLYEEAARAAFNARDLDGVRGNAMMAVKAYSDGGDVKNAIRFAMEAVNVLDPDHVGGFARHVRKNLQGEIDLAPFDALIAQRTGTANAPKLASFCSNCGWHVEPAEVLMPAPDQFACKSCGASLNR